MFNLLRRSTKKKKKAYQEKSPKAARYSAGAPAEHIIGGVQANPTGSIEHYRSYNEWQREHERERQRAAQLKGSPTQAKISRALRRAEIEEFDDLKDFEEDENEYCDEDARSNGSGLATAGRKAFCGGSGGVALTNERYVYFRGKSVDGERERGAGCKLNLAKTTAANNTTLSGAIDIAQAKEQTKFSLRRSAGGGADVATANRVKSLVLPIDAATLRANDSTQGELDVDKIKTFSADQLTLDVSDDDGYERGENERMARLSDVRGRLDCRDCESLNCHGSPNEEAEWQGRDVPLAKCKKYNRNDRLANRLKIESDHQRESLQDTSKSPIASNVVVEENVERAVKAIKSNENRIKDGNGNRYEGDTFFAVARTALATDTANAAAINEVKYRNFENTNRTSKKVQKNTEAKRQSRLSLTLGLNLKGARSKSITDVSTANNDSSSVTAYYSGSSSYSGREQRKRSQFGKAFRNSFLRGRSKSSDTETTLEDDSKQAFKNLQAEKSASSAGSKALKKSKEFLSDLFMARGRNHNRNRNPQAQAQAQYTPHNSHTFTQQKQQQQKLAQPQQQKQQIPPTKDVRTFAAVSAPTNVNNNSHRQHQNHPLQNQNTHNNSPQQVNPVVVMQNGQNNSVSTHLDVISDPLGSSTNSYQTTMSNNNAKNVSRVVADEERQRRSNSAGEQHLSARANWRSRSADPQWSESESGAQKEKTVNEEESVDQRLNGTASGKCGIIRQVSAEWNGNVKTAQAVENNAESVGKHQRGKCATVKESNQIVNGVECVLESKEEEEIESAHILSGKKRAIEAKQCNTAVTTCSSVANEAPLSAFPKTTTITTTPVPSANCVHNEREAHNLPPPIAAFTTTACPSVVSMGQTSAKPNDTAPSSRASTPREFRESVLPDTYTINTSECIADKQGVPILPKITIADYSENVSGQRISDSPVEQEVFYDFESEISAKRERAGIEISDVAEDHLEPAGNDIEEDETFHDQEIPATIYQPKWPLRYNHTKLENVPEQEENDEEEECENDEAYSGADSDTDDAETDDDAVVTKNVCADNLDNEFEGSQQNLGSPERGALKSGNTSDSNLSTSYPDSGISGIDSHCSSTSSFSHRHSSSDNDSRVARSTKSRSPTMQYHNNRHQQQQQQQNHSQPSSHQHSPFVRDGNSTDCDETLLQYDDLEYVAELDSNERLVCIESISLPDVVVESTTGASGANASASSAASPDSGRSSEQIININGATGNTIGNVHFIPIHVEGSDQATPKKRSVDDSVLGSGGGINKSFAHMNGMQQKSTIEITEDGCELTYGKANGHNNSNNQSGNDAMVEKLRQELIEQKSRYNTQVGDAQKNLQNLQSKVAEMQAKIEKLEQELSAKAWNVDRLQSELKAAQMDDDFVRKRLKLLEDEKTSLRHKYSENEDEFRRKYEELETQYNELEVKYKETKQLASNLQTQLATAQTEAEEWRKEVEKIRGELEAQISILKNALESSEAERKICQDKWQKEFEMLRTQTRDREETLMADCEWQLRQIQQQTKNKTEEILNERELATERAEQLQNELEERKQEVEDLKVYQAEVKSLRGVVAEQELAIKSLMRQIDNIRSELETANTNLEEQMMTVKKIKNQCDNALCDKEREVVNRINEVRHQAAVFWEDKLYTEMTRLKTELESVYVEERREALNKLQTEHIEELRAITSRYTANEDEIRTELNELQERFESKSAEFIEVRDKSDTNLLQMRMHLDRADREYQRAMCREEERREELEENLRQEFQTEREEMEEKFRERLSQVKEEFAKELQHSTQEMRQKHQKELSRQKAQIQAEKEEALQELADRHRKKLAAVEEQINEIELRHKHDLNDLKAAYDTEKAAMDKRDISNTSEIEQLHRKCRCLTNLFEEMRMRYERRDPRPEDLREIDELRSRCESQERDLFELTDRLREMQIQMTDLQATKGDAAKTPVKQVKKPPPKTIPTNCDVIYEDENEERESPQPQTIQPNNHADNEHDEEEEEEEEEDEGEDDEEDEEDEVVETAEKAVGQRKVVKNQSKIMNGNAKTASFIISNKELNLKHVDTTNESDESHMISAV